MHSKQLKYIQRLIFILFFAISVLLATVLAPGSQGVGIYFFDIGQGDSSMIVLPDNLQVIIDGGPGDSVVEKLGSYVPFYDRTIEYMILTHAHSDHLNGLVDVAKRYSISTFIYNGINEGAENLINELQKQDTRIIKITEKKSIYLSDNVQFEILFPDHILTPIEYKDPNDSSLIGRLVYNDTAVLFTGDAPQAVEAYLVNTGALISADIINIGHHGSKTSTDPRFIEIVDPLFGIISVGENNYGHPDARTLSTLRRGLVEVLRTDEEGDIHFISNGIELVRTAP